jgi:hypothetical protein
MHYTRLALSGTYQHVSTRSHPTPSRMVSNHHAPVTHLVHDPSDNELDEIHLRQEKIHVVLCVIVTNLYEAQRGFSVVVPV